MSDALVVDASAMVDLLLGTDRAAAIDRRFRDHELHAPAHFDAEVLSALGRLQRADQLSSSQVTARLRQVASAPITRHHLADLLTGAWKRRHNMRLVDAIYVELGVHLHAPVVTTDARLASAHEGVELVMAVS